MTRVRVTVGENLEALGREFIEAWHRSERGETRETEVHINYASWDQLSKALTPKRVELLRHVHRSPARSIRALSDALGREYKRVYEDVEALTDAGLLDRTDGAVRADYDRIETAIDL